VLSQHRYGMMDSISKGVPSHTKEKVIGSISWEIAIHARCLIGLFYFFLSTRTYSNYNVGVPYQYVRSGAFGAARPDR
jgi:hypothetical protein